MRFKEIQSRITGLSCAVFGVSWNPPEPEIAVARRVVGFLEDRRVLYAPSEMEVPDHCVRSVLEIRKFLTAEIQGLDGKSALGEDLRAMRASCRKFLDTANPDVVRHGFHQGHWASWEFNGALGELRGVFGIHLTRIAAAHGLDVEDDLAKILPGRDEDTPPAPHPRRAGKG